MQLHLDPSLQSPMPGLGGAGLAGLGLGPLGVGGMAGLGAGAPSGSPFTHFADPPLGSPAPASPFTSETNTVPNGQPNAGAFTDGAAGIKLPGIGPLGTDFTAGLTGAAGGEVGGQVGLSGNIGGGMRLGGTAGVSGTPFSGDPPGGNVGLKLEF